LNLSCGNCNAIQSFSGNPLKCDVCGWMSGTKPTVSASGIQHGINLLYRILGFLFLVFLAIFGLSLWESGYEKGWRFHDEITRMVSNPWINGEYKNCTTLNFQDETFMVCDQLIRGESKAFKIRFYGPTRFPGKPESQESQWQCRKNGDNDPTITCRMPKAEQ
jgi:hypothetical protein